MTFYLPELSFASSPSFPTRTILQESKNGLALEKSTNQDLPFDIKSVSYFSDGTVLHATLWLTSPICISQNCHGNLTMLRYGMKIFVSNITNPDYDMYIQRQNNGTWTKTIMAYEPGNPSQSQFKILENDSIPNKSNVFKDGSRYIDLSLNLADIGSPDKYYVYFYTANNSILDLTYTYRIPPQENIVVFKWPSPNSSSTLEIALR